MSDEVGRITQLNQKLVGPPESPAEKVRGRLRVVEERLALLEASTESAVNRTDAEIGDLVEALSAMSVVVAALLDAVQRIAGDPMNPASAGAAAWTTIEEAVNGNTESPDDGVVPEPARD